MRMIIILFAGIISHIVTLTIETIEDDFVYCPLNSLGYPISIDRYCEEPIENLIKIQHESQKFHHYLVKPLDFQQNQTIFECSITEYNYQRVSIAAQLTNYRFGTRTIKPNKEQCQLMFAFKTCTQPNYTELKMTCPVENNCITERLARDSIMSPSTPYSDDDIIKLYFNKSNYFTERECQIVKRNLTLNELTTKNCSDDSTFCDIGNSVIYFPENTKQMCPFQLLNQSSTYSSSNAPNSTPQQTYFINCGLRFFSQGEAIFVLEDEKFNSNKQRLMPYQDRNCNSFRKNLTDFSRNNNEEFLVATLPGKNTVYFFRQETFIYNVECTKIKNATFLLGPHKFCYNGVPVLIELDNINQTVYFGGNSILRKHAVKQPCKDQSFLLPSKGSVYYSSFLKKYNINSYSIEKISDNNQINFNSVNIKPNGYAIGIIITVIIVGLLSILATIFCRVKKIFCFKLSMSQINAKDNNYLTKISKNI